MIWRYIIVFGLLVGAVPAQEEEQASPFPPQIQRAVHQVIRLDEGLKQVVTAYHKKQNHPQLERKLEQMLKQRRKAASRVAKPVEARIKVLNHDLEKIRKEVDKLYAAEEGLDPVRNAVKVQAIQKKFSDALVQQTATENALRQHEDLLAKLLEYSPPEDIGLPEGVVEKLPIFEDGPAKGYFAHYVGTGYEALVDPQGKMTIRILQAGSGTPYSHEVGWFYPVMNHKPPGSKRMKPREMLGLVPPSDAPMKQPSQLNLRGFYEGYSQFRLHIQFAPSSIVVSGGQRDPIDLLVPGQFILETKFPGILRPLPMDDGEPGSFKEYEALFKAVKDRKQERFDLSYLHKPPSGTGVKSVRLLGPWGRTELEMKVKGKVLPMTDKSPRKIIQEGWRMRYACDGQDITKPGGAIMLTVHGARR